MIRLLITGSSHTAAIRRAWDNLTDRPADLAVDFLGANVDEFRHFGMNDKGVFGLHDESLAPESQRQLAISFSGTLRRRVADYTHVLLAGCELSNMPLLRLLAACRIDLLREGASDKPRLSQAAYTAFSRAIALRTYRGADIAAMRPWVNLGVMSSPRMSEAVLANPAAQPLFQAQADHPEGIRAALDLTDQALAQVCREDGATYFAPPVESLTEIGFSHLDYARNSVHIRATKPADHFHMNAAYGASCLAQIMAWLQAGPAL